MLPLLEIGAKLIDKVIPDLDARAKAKAELARLQASGELREVESAAKIVIAEAQGDSWLQRSWRPILMLVFAGLIVAKWLGLTAPGISEAVELKLFQILQVGIGGYVIGRSAEKTVKAWKQG